MTYSLLNARVWDDVAQAFVSQDLHINRGQFAPQPVRGARRVDLNGAIMLPGLINAHDHLAMNHYPRSSFRDVYPNAHVWGEEVNAKLNTEPYKSLRAAPLADQVFIGGLKNLLSGVTTVVHHDAPHKPLFARDFPVKVLPRYGWSHTLHFTPQAEIIKSFRETPPGTLWFIHLAEGTDEVARAEYVTLRDMGCVGHHTVLIHGVGLSDADLIEVAPRVAALIVSPSTNRYLLNAYPPIEAWQNAGGTVLYGSDSRLTADGDLLNEIAHFTPEYITKQMALTGHTLHLKHTGYIAPGATADLVILDGMTRAQVKLVMRDGHPWLGASEIMSQFGTKTTAAQVDGVDKCMDAGLAKQILACSLKEPGLEVEAPYIRKWFFQR